MKMHRNSLLLLGCIKLKRNLEMELELLMKQLLDMEVLSKLSYGSRVNIYLMKNKLMKFIT